MILSMHGNFSAFVNINVNCNLFVTTKYKTTNSPIHELLHKGLLTPPFQWCIISYLLLFKHCIFISKALKDIVQYYELVNWWIRGFFLFVFDVTNRLLENYWILYIDRCSTLVLVGFQCPKGVAPGFHQSCK